MPASTPDAPTPVPTSATPASTAPTPSAPTSTTPGAAAPRALAPDLARGLMLLLIAVANVSVYLWGHDTPLYTNHPVDGDGIDLVLSVIGILFVDARIYPLFAFLFGYGMVQFAMSRHVRGVRPEAVRSMLWRRHWWLLAFGFAHAALLFAGDILGAYGLAGLVLTAALFWRSDRAVRITAWILLGLFSVAVLLSLAAAAAVGLLLPPEAQALIAGAGTGDGAGGFGDLSNADLLNGIPGYGWALLVRIGLWLVATPATVLALLVPACILLGWLAARHRWLEVPGSRIRLGAVAAWGLAIGTLGAAPPALIHLGVLPALEPVAWGLMPLDQLAGVAGGVGYAALFGALGVRLRGRSPAGVRAIAAVGRRSLSCYLLQSVVFAPLLAAWGFGLGSRIGTAAAFAIALAVWLLSVALAVMLERRGARGPAEALLRRLTYSRFDRAAGEPPISG
ncbi:DUF418 domain-containing protein [Leucobacter sp. CSA1]|uniref:DUF418 domain-containing protein n=1 Tax=Leucobacter chromiisoli TaxID=2796471 RepID=A0A934Q3V0_9MICO|nr:DUF418 domain-containing protein [Leucobacter chromiisoli]MBK0417960.1 DUF418 domain-containing protein [Leucobacter chromiisoli]